MGIPEWVQDAVFYQIFPDRFANGDLSTDPPNIKAWNTQPTYHSFFGGDLMGIEQHLDYLQDLGVTALYLNPIFLASSNHRYNTTDYYTIDPKLGDLKRFKSLVENVHQRGMRILLDGVFNHCGRGFFAFSDILENNEHSPYLDWFHILHMPVDAYGRGELKDYLGWWNLRSLPKFNTKTLAVRKYLLGVARHWIDQGTDGWRLDVPNEIDDDSFWAEFRQVVRSANPEAYLVGEIWEPSLRWVGDEHFDGLMNYPLRDAILGLLAGEFEVSEFARRLEDLFALYPADTVRAMYNTLGTHDTARVITILEGSIDKVKLAFLLLFAYPGVPAIYYGDEIGLAGGKDPDCRRTFPWEEQRWKMGIRDWVCRLIQLRKEMEVLRRGDFHSQLIDNEQSCYVFTRTYQGQHILGAVNCSASPRSIMVKLDEPEWQDGQKMRSLTDDGGYTLHAGQLEIELQPYSGILLK